MDALLSAAAASDLEGLHQTPQVVGHGNNTVEQLRIIELEGQLQHEIVQRKRMQLGLDQLKARLAHGIRYSGKSGSSKNSLVKRERASAKRRIEQLGYFDDNNAALEQVLNCVYVPPNQIDIVREAQEVQRGDDLDEKSERSLVVVTGVPSKIIYHRLIKPFPVVKLVGLEQNSKNVLVTLDVVQANAPSTVVTALHQTYVVPLDSKTQCAEFRKLKLNVTSASVNSAFRLRFSLKQEPNIQGLTEPFYVYSHTSYLTNDKAGGAKKKAKRKKIK